MIVRSSHIITLPSGNLARDFRWESLGYGRVRVQYNYTDRRRANQVARKFTVEFLNGKVESFQPAVPMVAVLSSSRAPLSSMSSLRCSQSSTRFVHGVAERHEPSKVEETETEQDSASEDDTASDTSTDLMNTVRLVGIGVVVNLMVTLVTLGIVWYNL